VDAIHISEVLANRLEEYGSSLSKGIKVTFHDPCRLGRHHGIYDAPRNALSKISHLKEMENSKEDSICCGVSAWMNCNPASKLARLKRLRQANDVEAEVLVTACSKCQTHLGCVYREESYDGDPKDLQVLDLQEFVADALGVKVPESLTRQVKGKRLEPIQEDLFLKDALSKEGIENAFACTTCERCEVECEYAYEAVHDVESLRKDVVACGQGPKSIGRSPRRSRPRERLRRSGWIFYPRERLRLLPGCVAQLQTLALEDTLKVLDALASIMNPFVFVCCSVLKRTGHDSPEVNFRTKAATGERSSPCAGCYSPEGDYGGLDVVMYAVVGRAIGRSGLGSWT
jgi:Fe-S oxidoreductase